MNPFLYSGNNYFLINYRNFMKVFQYLLFCTFLVLSVSCVYNDFNRDHYLLSPDESLSLTLHSDEQKISYSLKKNNQLLIEKSQLGLLADQFELAEGLDVKKVTRSRKNEMWTQVWGEQKHITDNHNELAVHLSSKTNQMQMVIRFRLFNDGLGFRYELPEQNEMNDFKILDELTEFNFSEDSESWWIPAYAYRRFEFLYANTPISDISRDTYSKLVENLNGPRLGPEAVHTPFTVQRNDGICIAIHEANLTNYSSMTLQASGTSKMECDLVPWSDGTKVYASLPFQSPWRTIIVGNNPAELAMSTLTLNLNEPNKLSNTDWIEPGKYIGIWWEMIGTNQSTWGSGAHHGAKTQKVKDYIDFGSKYGFKGVLVEGWNTGWDVNWCCSGDGEAFDFYHSHPDFDSKEVKEYARKKNIRIIGHHETGGQIQNYESQLDSAFAYAQRNDIRVIKTGYVNDVSQNISRIGADGNVYKEWHHGQYMVEHFRKVIETAAKYQVSLVPHEPIKDTGIRRTYPNILSREGAKGQEFNGFMSTKDNNKPNHTTILPFTRLLSSPMDYTPGIFNIKEYRYNSPDDRTINTNHHIPSTISKELALYIVVYAPAQMAADLPENYVDHPAFQFILDVPTDWEQTVVLNGEIGQYITTARKDIQSDDWYLGSITNEKGRDLTINLSFLDSGVRYQATIYKDPTNGGWQTNPEEVVIETIMVEKNDVYKVSLMPGGGQAIRFSPM